MDIPKPRKKAGICYPITGLIKHAQVARILFKNNVSTRQFYIVCRACQEQLPLPTLTDLRKELGAKGKTATSIGESAEWLRKKGLLKRHGQGRKATYEPTDKGYAWYLLLIAEMERPIRDGTVYDHPKKTKFKRPKRGLGPKAGRAQRRTRFSALAKKVGLSIWERSELCVLPQWQRLDSGEPKSSAPASSASITPTPAQAQPRPGQWAFEA
jgi:hypothetical protein